MLDVLPSRLLPVVRWWVAREVESNWQTCLITFFGGGKHHRVPTPVVGKRKSESHNCAESVRLLLLLRFGIEGLEAVNRLSSGAFHYDSDVALLFVYFIGMQQNTANAKSEILCSRCHKKKKHTLNVWMSLRCGFWSLPHCTPAPIEAMVTQAQP